MTPCEEVAKCGAYTVDGNKDITITVGADPAGLDAHLFICLMDMGGHQHLRTRKVGAVIMMESIMRASRASLAASLQAAGRE